MLITGLERDDLYLTSVCVSVCKRESDGLNCNSLYGVYFLKPAREVSDVSSMKLNGLLFII